VLDLALAVASCSRGDSGGRRGPPIIFCREAGILHPGRAENAVAAPCGMGMHLPVVRAAGDLWGRDEVKISAGLFSVSEPTCSLRSSCFSRSGVVTGCPVSSGSVSVGPTNDSLIVFASGRAEEGAGSPTEIFPTGLTCIDQGLILVELGV